MNEAFKIIYSKARFPIRQLRPDGTFGCRGCGGDIPPKRQTWCSTKCAKQYHPGYVLIEVRSRDKDICSMCGLDCRKARNEWRAERHSMGFSWDEWRRRRPPSAEYDHIVPFSEGGLTVLENIRTLCSNCHKKRTAAWKKSKSKNKQVAVFG